MPRKTHSSVTFLIGTGASHNYGLDFLFSGMDAILINDVPEKMNMCLHKFALQMEPLITRYSWDSSSTGSCR